jgi:polysaccharide chain length determinant protein (PEP-CTERM system associated)
MTNPINLLLLRQYLHSVWRRRWYGVALAWAVCAIAWTVIARIPDYYVSSARIYMNSDEALTPLLKGIAVADDIDARLDRLQRTLLSNTNMEKLIRMTDLDARVRDSADRQQLVATLQRKILVKPQTRNLFTVSYADADPALAESVVSSLLSIFMEENAGRSRTDIDSAQRFLQSEIDRLETQLREDERKKADFQSRYYDLLPDAESGASRLDAAREAVRKLTSDLADGIAEREDLQKQIDATPQFDVTPVAAIPDGAGGGLSTSPQTRLAQLQAQLDIAKATMTDEHPLVIALKHQIELVRAELAEAPAAKSTSAKLGNPVYRDLAIRLSNKEADLAALRRRLVSAEQDRDAIEDEARKAPGVEAAYIDLTRDYDVVKANYETLLARRESAKIAENADRRGDEVTLQTIDPPEVPLLPSGPNRPLYASLAFVAGIGAGALAAFMLGQMDSSFATTTALALLGLPVLGSVRLIDGSLPGRGHRLAGAHVFVSACLALAIVYVSLIAFFIGMHPDI